MSHSCAEFQVVSLPENSPNLPRHLDWLRIPTLLGGLCVVFRQRRLLFLGQGFTCDITEGSPHCILGISKGIMASVTSQLGPSLFPPKLCQASLATLKLGVLDGSVSQRHLHGNHLHTWSVSPPSFWGFCLRGEARLTVLLPLLRYLSPHSSSSSQILHRQPGLLLALTCKAHSSVPCIWL